MTLDYLFIPSLLGGLVLASIFLGVGYWVGYKKATDENFYLQMVQYAHHIGDLMDPDRMEAISHFRRLLGEGLAAELLTQRETAKLEVIISEVQK